MSVYEIQEKRRPHCFSLLSYIGLCGDKSVVFGYYAAWKNCKGESALNVVFKCHLSDNWCSVQNTGACAKLKHLEGFEIAVPA